MRLSDFTMRSLGALGGVCHEGPGGADSDDRKREFCLLQGG